MKHRTLQLFGCKKLRESCKSHSALRRKRKSKIAGAEILGVAAAADGPGAAAKSRTGARGAECEADYQCELDRSEGPDVKAK